MKDVSEVAILSLLSVRHLMVLSFDCVRSGVSFVALESFVFAIRIVDSSETPPTSQHARLGKPH